MVGVMGRRRANRVKTFELRGGRALTKGAGEEWKKFEKECVQRGLGKPVYSSEDDVDGNIKTLRNRLKDRLKSLLRLG